jgi:CBS domain-containing protein
MLAARHNPAATRVIDVASKTPVWCDATATVHEVAELMMEQYVRHVLVRENGRLVGIVSARDLLGAYTASTE